MGIVIKICALLQIFLPILENRELLTHVIATKSMTQMRDMSMTIYYSNQNRNNVTVIILDYSNQNTGCKGLFKRMQHVGPTSSNIVVSDMLGPFEHHVGYCCIMLDDVGSSLILFKLFIQHRPIFDE